MQLRKVTRKGSKREQGDNNGSKILGQKKEKQARREFQIKNSIPDFVVF